MWEKRREEKIKVKRRKERERDKSVGEKNKRDGSEK